MNYKANFTATYVMVDSHIKGEKNIMQEAFELIEDETFDMCDVDVLWHGLHFLLTDVVDFEKSTNALSGIIYGFEVFEDSDDLFFSYTSADNMEIVVDKLGDIEAFEIVEKFDKQSFIDNKITPAKLFKTSDEEEIFDELIVCLEELIDFYYRAYEQGKSVAVVLA